MSKLPQFNTLFIYRDPNCYDLNEMKVAAMPGRYDYIDFIPPVSVAKEAEKGLEYRRKAGGKGGLSPAQAAKEGVGSGVQRAINLKNRDKMSPKTVRRMKSFFDRHEKNKAIDPEFKGEPYGQGAGRWDG